MVGEAGFEPAKAWPPDLQSGLVGRLSIPPWESAHRPERGPNATLLTLRQPRVYRVQSAERRFRHLPVQVSFSVSRQGDKSPGRFRTTSGMFYIKGSPWSEWSQRRDSNPQPLDYKSRALPIEATLATGFMS